MKDIEKGIPDCVSGFEVRDEKYTYTEGEFINVSLALLQCRGLNASEKVVLMALLSFCHARNLCYPKQATLVERAGTSLKTVQRCLENLRLLGLLTWTDWIEHDERRNLYVLLPAEALCQRLQEINAWDKNRRELGSSKFCRRDLLREEGSSKETPISVNLTHSTRHFDA